MLFTNLEIEELRFELGLGLGLGLVGVGSDIQRMNTIPTNSYIKINISNNF